MRAYSLAKSPAQYMKQWDGVDITNLSTPRSAISLRRLAWLMRARILACASASVAALAGCLVPREKCPTVSPCTFMKGPQNSWRFSMPSVSKWAWTSISMAFSLLSLVSAPNHRLAGDWLELRWKCLSTNINTLLICVQLISKGIHDFKRWKKAALAKSGKKKRPFQAANVCATVVISVVFPGRQWIRVSCRARTKVGRVPGSHP